jgi:hypothetical protein
MTERARSGSESVPKCHGSTILLSTFDLIEIYALDRHQN